MRTEILKIGNLDVEVRFKPIKNLHLSVHPPLGRVTVSSPEFFDLEKVRVYLITKIAWIKREQEKISNQDREAKKLFITRESHHFLGRRYLLNVISAGRSKIVLKHSTIDLYAVENASTLQKQKTMYNWYKIELAKVILKFLSLYSAKMNLPVPVFHIRKMKTKWGSCTTDIGNVWFNIELAKKPKECIEYIVVHEMVHLIERNHNKMFIILMDKYLPNWRLQKRLLNELPL